MLRNTHFLRWKTFADGTHPNGGPVVERLVYAEFEAYGRGFAGEPRYRTQVVDLGRPATLARVLFHTSKWRRAGTLLEAPDAAAEIRIRFRTGTDADPRTYYTFNDQGGLEEMDRSEWRALRARPTPYAPEFVGWQGPITEDRENWTPWSGPVTESGTRLEMPSNQFFQVQIEFSSGRPTDMTRLDSLSIEVQSLLVPTLIGEVALAGDPLSPNLAQVTLGKPTALTYAVCAKFATAGHVGFDAVRIATPARPEFLQLLMGSPSEVVSPDSFTTDPTGLTVYLPRRVDADIEAQIELRTTLYTLSTQLRGEVFNRTESEKRQRIEAGDATDRIRSNRLQVVAEGSDLKGVIDQLELQPLTVTPNGDGINDRMEIIYSLVGVVDTDVEISFFTLSGVRVDDIELHGQRAGPQRVEWTGTDAAGQRLDPGSYLCQVSSRTGRDASRSPG